MKYIRHFLCAAFFLSAAVYAQTIINPAPGTWANRQTLVLELPDGFSAYYSLDGSNPEKSGLAYDAPTLLDMSGSVSVRVLFVSPHTGKNERQVSYYVSDAPLPKTPASAAFLQNALHTGTVRYVAGDTFDIPVQLQYCLGTECDIFEDGRGLAVSSDTLVARYFPCTVTDGQNSWRFIIHSTPRISGLYSRRNVPFEITDWETLTFIDQTMIYKIDGGWWERPTEPIKLDRTKSHTISWQRVDYSPENPVTEYFLPPKPEFAVSTEAEGAVYVTAENPANYKFAVYDGPELVPELYEYMKIDAFQGDAFSGTVTAALFYDSVYQGTASFSYNINRRRPQQPILLSSAPSALSRRKVTVTVRNPGRHSLYLSLTGPIIIDPDKGGGIDTVPFELFSQKYEKFSGNELQLNPVDGKGAGYRISAYTEDVTGRRSRIAEYKVIVDQCNYYLDGNATDEASVKAANGSKEYPFASFASLLSFINRSRVVHIRVKGKVPMPKETIMLSTNCRMDGSENAELLFGQYSSVILRNASLAVSNTMISMDAPSALLDKNTRPNIFQLEHSALDLQNVELSALFGEHGTVIDAEDSVINLNNCTVAATAVAYSSAVTAMRSKITVRDSRIATNADTAVNFSVQSGIFELRTSRCSITGSMGRTAELFDTASAITDNAFTADLKKPRKTNEPIYNGKNNISMEYSGNTSTGF